MIKITRPKDVLALVVFIICLILVIMLLSTSKAFSQAIPPCSSGFAVVTKDGEVVRSIGTMPTPQGAPQEVTVDERDAYEGQQLYQAMQAANKAYAEYREVMAHLYIAVPVPADRQLDAPVDKYLREGYIWKPGWSEHFVFNEDHTKILSKGPKQ